MNFEQENISNNSEADSDVEIISPNLDTYYEHFSKLERALDNFNKYSNLNDRDRDDARVIKNHEDAIKVEVAIISEEIKKLFESFYANIRSKKVIKAEFTSYEPEEVIAKIERQRVNANNGDAVDFLTITRGDNLRTRAEQLINLIIEFKKVTK